MNRRVLLVICAALASPAALASRLPLQSDVDRCALDAQASGASAQGRLQLGLLLRKSGQVYAAHVRAQGGIEDRRLQRCLSAVATRWQFPPAEADSRRPFSLSMVPGGTAVSTGGSEQGRPSVFLPDLSQTDVEEPLDEPAARASLELLEDATHAERGEALLTVRALPEAIAELRLSLEELPENPLALRALAQALVEQQETQPAQASPLAEARALAEQLQALDPDSAAGNEALLRVCLAAADDACAVAAWQAARSAPDLQPRARSIAGMTAATRAAAARLQAQAASAPQPPVCSGDAEEQALCVVRLCLEEGTYAFSQSLAAQNGERYRQGAWRAHDAGGGRVVVTRPIAADAQGPEEHAARGSRGSRHDAVWLVKVGDQVRVTPVSAEAHQISAQNRRCGCHATAARSIGNR